MFPKVFTVSVLGLLLVCGGRAGWCGPRDNDEVVLFFPGGEEPFLSSATHRITGGRPLYDRIRAVAALLLSNPEGRPPALPAGFGLRQLFLGRNGVVYVDFSVSPSATVPDIMTERLHLWSWINSFCINFPEIQSVKILIEGEEADTFWGHIDITSPLLPDRTLVK